MRLGDLDALKSKAVPLLFPTKMEPCGHITVPVQAVVVSEIEQAPTIDAVEVVRCKDCIHYEERSCEQGLCHFWDCSPEYGLNVVVFNDYCSYGERKDGEA